MKLLYLSSLLFLYLLPGHHRFETAPAATTIQGVVLGKDGKPVSKAYLFIVKGEEEAMTNNNGYFTLTTYQTFPVSVTVEHPSYKKIKTTIKEVGAKQVIKLEQL